MTEDQPGELDDGLVTLAEAADQLGVHYMTAYRYVRTGRMVAEKRGGKWWVTPADLAAVVAEGTGARRRSVDPDVEPRELLVEPFTARLIAGDTAACWDIIGDALTAGATPAEIHHRLLRVALEQVGDGWRRGELTVSDEHRATATASRLLGQMGPLFRHRGRRRGTILLGAVAGDPHSLPSAMLADLLSDRRFTVIDLGANTPAASFVEVAEQCDDLIGIGVCSVLDEMVSIAVNEVRSLRAALPEVLLVVGGRGIAAAAADFAGIADLVAEDAEQVCAAFERAASPDAYPSPSTGSAGSAGSAGSTGSTGSTGLSPGGAGA